MKSKTKYHLNRKSYTSAIHRNSTAMRPTRSNVPVSKHQEKGNEGEGETTADKRPDAQQ